MSEQTMGSSHGDRPMTVVAPPRPDADMDEAAEQVGLGEVAACFRAERWLFLPALLGGPVLGAVSIWQCGRVVRGLLQSESSGDVRGLFWITGLLCACAATLALVTLWRLRIHVHEHGMVVRSIDGIRAFEWSAVRSAASYESRILGERLELLEIVLAHGEVLRIVGLAETELLHRVIQRASRGQGR